MQRLAVAINRLPWLFALGGLGVALAAGAGSALLTKGYDTRGFQNPTWPSLRADAQLNRASGRQLDEDFALLVKLPAPAAEPASANRVAGIADRLWSDPNVAQVVTFYNSGDPALVSRDHRSTLVFAYFHNGVTSGDAAQHLMDAFRGDPNVALGGASVLETQVQLTTQSDLAHAEELAFPLIFVLALWFFRGLVAALMPILVGGLNIVISLFLLHLVNSYVTTISVYALNLVTGVGLGLSIDYSLFVIWRYREELARGADPAAAITAALRHAGPTVLFSAVTVAAAGGSLLVFPVTFLWSMGVGALIVPLVAAATALLVLAPILRLLGHRVNSLGLRRWQSMEGLRSGRGPWYRFANGVMRAPALIALAAAAFLILVGLPFARIHFTWVDPTDLPAGTSSHYVADRLQHDFTGFSGADIKVVAHLPAGRRADLLRFTQTLSGTPGVAGVTAPQNIGGDSWLIRVRSHAGVYSDSAKALVKRLRGLQSPSPFLVGGWSAKFVDLQATLLDRLPLAVALVALTTMLVLFIMTRSVVLPIKAVLMNLLTLSAAFGLLVAIFQDGRLQALLDYRTQGALESTQPVLLFAIVFGLSTDYGVFLLSRIKEAHDSGLENRQAVATGLERTGRIVTAAAVLFCIAMGAFSTSNVLFVKELGIGTAAGVLIDATIVRALLVPSLMALLGRWNWWSPVFSRRARQQVGVSPA